jgi:tetratricopeptide (TPR) repeat protein
MLQRAQEGDVAARFPGMLSRLGQLLLLDLGDFSKAETLLSDGVRAFPGEIELRVDLTRARVGRGLNSDTIRKLRTNAKRALRDGALELPLGRFEIDFHERLVPLRPSFDTRYFPEDEIRTALDIPGLTSQAADRRLSVVTNLKLAQIALSQDDVKDAEDRVALAKKEAGTDPEVHLTEALVRSRAGEAVRARDSIEEALRIAPDDPRILIAAARLQTETGDLRAAQRSLQRIEEEGFESPTALALAARLATKEGRFDDAREIIEKARALARTDPQVLSAALHVEHDAGELDAARKVARDISQGNRENAKRLADRDYVIRAYVAWSDAGRGEADRALATLKEIVDARAGFAAGHLMLGLVLGKQNQPEESQAALEEAARLAGEGPVFDRAQSQLGGGGDAPAPKKKPKKRGRRRGRR